MPDDQETLWSKIVEKHGERVFRIALRILGSIHDAEDVTQDVFTEAFQLHQKNSVQRWPGLLVRLVTLRSIDRLRRMRPVMEHQADQHRSHVDPFELAVATELSNWLRSALAQLPNQQGAVFAMVCLEQLRS